MSAPFAALPLGALALLLAATSLRAAAPLPLPAAVANVIERHCANCHDDVTKEGNLDLTALTLDPTSPRALATWTKVHDRVAAGEMPPKKKPRPPAEELTPFLTDLAHALVAAESTALSASGRARHRRLNRYEYENSVRDLLALPYLAIRDSLPEDPTAHGYNKLGEALDVSHVQMARYLRTAEFALREAIAPQVAQPAASLTRYHTWLQPGFVRAAGPEIRKTFPIVGLELQSALRNRNDPVTKRPTRANWAAASRPERRNDEAAVMLMSTYEPAEIKFDRFRAPVTARYKLRFSGYTVWMARDFSAVSRGRRSEPVVVYAQTPPRSLRRLGAFDFAPDASVHEIEVWLHAGETIQPDAARLVRSRPPDFKNPLAEADGMPGVAFQWMEVEGPLIDTWPPPGHALLFDRLPITDPSAAVKQAAAKPEGFKAHVDVTSAEPARDAARLLRRFMTHALRGPVAETDYRRFLGLIETTLAKGHSFTDAMIAGYTAVLSSPGFIYLQPSQGRLGPDALAERLAYFLWNSPPDAALRARAASGALARPDVLRAEVDRLLDAPQARRFVDAFLDYWLDLRRLTASGPDAELYPEYQLDDLLTESMPEETQLTFAELLRHNLPVRHVAASDFALLNERLATLYGIPGVQGVHFRRVALPADTVRGGFLTHASVLKVTANGTTSSPVVRGAWIMERILGQPPPPPPAAVPAVEADIRGATTLREQLARHRSEESCNACHRKIDPPGFALEEFDVMGGWRNRYRASSQGTGERVTGFGHDGLIFRYRTGPAVDSSGELPDGRPFRDIREFKQAIAADPAVLAANLVRQLAVYATGAPIRFSDRAAVARILARSRASDYGVRTLLHELISSDLFLSK